MDIKMHHNALSLFRQIFNRKLTTAPRIETPPQKPSFGAKEPIQQPFNRTSPELQGISSDFIASFLTELKDDKTLDLHNIMILKNGSVIAEGSFGAYDMSYWHITHSECKSITGLAIGMLIDEGKLKLDDEISKIFEKRNISLSHLTHKNITVQHLLTMTSGIVFNEAGSVTENDWVKYFLESTIKTDPGKHFNYNSMNTYMLSAIVKQISGQSLTEYLNDHLFKPLGITKIFWETCPKGIEKGGWGLYIRPEDIAKIGQMVLDKGKWKGKQLVSEEWINEATTMKTVPHENLGNFNYGYQIWVGREHESFLFNGMFGQNVIGFKKTGILVVINAGNCEMFQQSNFFNLAEKYFAENHDIQDELKENPDAYKRLLLLQNNLGKIEIKEKTCKILRILGIKKAEKLPEICYELNGKKFIMEDTHAVSIGLLPLFVQVIQNNYSKGLKSIAFEVINEEFFIIISEADESYNLPLGFNEVKYTELIFHGEPYMIGVLGRCAKNEDDVWVINIRVSFLEIANSRLIKIYLHGEEIVIKWSELPGKEFLYNAMDSLITELKTKPLVDGLLTKVDSDYVDYKIVTSLEPQVTAKIQKP